jgi:putative Mn2+ efflux pump MntP
MGFGAILLLAIGLAMDAAAAAAARGVSLARIQLRHMLLVAFFFGGSQALMPVAGWMIGARLGPMVRAWDHWIAFVLLSVLGMKMLRDAYRADPDTRSDPATDDFRARNLSILAIATSIDALAVGITLPMLDAPFFTSIITIGVTTAVLSVLGLFAGHRFGAMLGSKLDIAGGLILIGLGVKILIEHEFFGGG